MAIDNRKPKSKIKEDLKKIEDLKIDEPPKETPIEEPEETPEETPVVEEVEEEPVKEEPEKESTKEEPIIDYKEKFVASTREAQVLSAKNKKLVEIIDQASELPEPTGEELMADYPDWEVLSEFERKIAKDNLLNKRKFNLVHQAVQEAKKIDEWVDKVDKFVEEVSASGKYPELEGKEIAFTRFCLKPTRRGVDFEDLAKAFLFDLAPPEKHKGSLLETGTGGPKELKPKEYTSEEISRIRTKDHRRYRRLIKEGKIKIEL
jgi:hypothetical protein